MLKIAMQKRKLSLKEDQNGNWVFAMDPTEVPNPDCEQRLIYDPNRGAIVGGEWESKMPNGKPNFLWKKMEVTLVKLANDFWVPQRIDETSLSQEKKALLVTRWVF